MTAAEFVIFGTKMFGSFITLVLLTLILIFPGLGRPLNVASFWTWVVANAAILVTIWNY